VTASPSERSETAPRSRHAHGVTKDVCATLVHALRHGRATHVARVAHADRARFVRGLSRVSSRKMTKALEMHLHSLT
jgi:hypothetical protein